MSLTPVSFSDEDIGASHPCNQVSASADPRHEWRSIKCPFTLHHITLHYITFCRNAVMWDMHGREESIVQAINNYGGRDFWYKFLSNNNMCLFRAQSR